MNINKFKKYIFTWLRALGALYENLNRFSYQLPPTDERFETNQGVQSVTSTRSEHCLFSHSSYWVAHPPIHSPWLLKHRLDRDLNPRPHSTEQADHASHCPHRPFSLGCTAFPAMGGTIETAVEQGGKLVQNWLSTSRPTQERPPKAGVGLPHDLRRVFMPISQDWEQPDHSDQSVQPPCCVQFVTCK